MMLKLNKKICLVVTGLSLFSLSACAKNKAVATNNGGFKNQEAVQPVQKQNPEVEKLKTVLEGMSGRFKGDVHIDDYEAFLTDLKSVLATCSDFAEDDLSQFYLIDKTHNVSENYVPKGLIHLENNPNYKVNKNNLSLRPEAYEALALLGAAAKADGVTLTVSSTYRSYEYQKNLFDYWVRVDGLEEAERESARPGTSQHQLGLALDFAPVDDAFDETPGGQWVYAHAADFGWSLSFPKMYEDVTGYRWECWHFRYVGIPACKFQRKYFNNVQQYMIEFIDAWLKA